MRFKQLFNVHIVHGQGSQTRYRSLEMLYKTELLVSKGEKCDQLQSVGHLHFLLASYVYDP